MVETDDGKDGGTASATASVTISNQAPTISSVSLSPDPVYTNDTLTVSATIEDDDGDTLTTSYDWYVEDALVQSGSDNTLDGEDWFDKDDEVYVVITVNDEIETSSAISETITIENTPPEAPEVSIDPEELQAGTDDLVCVIDTDASDEDGDSISYTIEWDVDGTEYTSATTTYYTDDTVPAEDTNGEDVWICTITPSDGDEDGDSASASLTIEDTCGEEGSTKSCPGTDCFQILEDGFSAGDGTYWIDPDEGEAFEVYCDMTTDDGGWTLISVHSDDDQDNWTWNNQDYFDTNSTTLGSLDELNKDLKSPAMQKVEMTDLLFIHAPSGVWAAYSGVDTSGLTFGDFHSGIGMTCWNGIDGYPMTAGTLAVSTDLCSTDLYFNALDQDGGSSCSSEESEDPSYGPTWSTDLDDGCPFNDPGLRGALGPLRANPDYEQDPSYSIAIGFGLANGLNTGTAGAAENYMQVYVRR
jgi:hypothetical protein